MTGGNHFPQQVLCFLWLHGFLIGLLIHLNQVLLSDPSSYKYFLILVHPEDRKENIREKTVIT